MTDRWYRRGPVLFAAGVLVTGLVIVGAVTVITGDPRAAVRPPAGGIRASPPAAGTPAGLATAADGFVSGADAAVAAVTGLDYRSLDVALTTGLGVTTGTYQRAYRTALTGTAARQLRAGRVVQSFEPSATGIGAVSSDLRTGRVLIFGVQTTRRGSSGPRITPLTLTATMVRRGDRYLISRLDGGSNPGLPSSSPDLARAAETARQNTLTGLGAKGTTGRVTALAVERAGADEVVLLVAGTATRVVDGRTDLVTDARLRVTVRRTSGGTGWQVIASQSAIE